MNIQEQISRVLYMESLYERIEEALQSQRNVKEQLSELQDEIRELSEYYEGPAWMEDYESEQQGEFPFDMNRGILTEDTLYDLICDVEAVRKSDVTF